MAVQKWPLSRLDGSLLLQSASTGKNGWSSQCSVHHALLLYLSIALHREPRLTISLRGSRELRQAIAMYRHHRRPHRGHAHPALPPAGTAIEPGEDAPALKITMLGAGQEVGRSCCVIEYRGKKVVCDAGLHPAHPGMGSLPFIDEVDWSTVDAILITQ